MSILMSPVLIRYHVDHSGLLPWEICDLLLQQYGKLGSHHPPCIYLIVQFQYACIAVSELLTRPPWKIALSTRVRCCLCTVSFAVVLQTPYFQSCLESTVFFFSPLLSVRLFHTFVIQLDCLVTFCISSLDFPNLLHDLKIIYIY